MRRAEARSAGIDRPDGVVRSFQVSVYKVEPTEAVLACNLLAKDDVRAALRDEAEEVGPEVAGVIDAAALSGCAERLTGTGAGPDGPVVGPPGKTQGVAPDADAGEEVALSKSRKSVWRNVPNVSFIDFPTRDVSLIDKFPQPIRCFRIDLVVVRGH
jgi:hypothetical protein